jgi:hypothetical protein
LRLKTGETQRHAFYPERRRSGWALASAHPALAAPKPADEGEATFRATYKELVETNTAVSDGSCTLAAQRMAARLTAAGYGADQITLFATPEHPKDGGLVAVLPGTAKAQADPAARPSRRGGGQARGLDPRPFDRGRRLFLWPGRGRRQGDGGDLGRYDGPAQGRKAAQAHGQAGADLRRGNHLGLQRRAVAGGQQTRADRRGIRPQRGGGGKTNGKGLSEGGKLVSQSIQVGEKAVQNYRLETRNPGGHSSTPVRDNAIYELADALVRLRAYNSRSNFPTPRARSLPRRARRGAMRWARR